MVLVLNSLTAIEVFFHDLHHQLGILLKTLADVGIFERFEWFDNVIDHIGIEDTGLLEDGTMG